MKYQFSLNRILTLTVSYETYDGESSLGSQIALPRCFFSRRIYKFNGPHRMVLRICLNILKFLLILLLFVKSTSTLIFVEKFK